MNPDATWLIANWKMNGNAQAVREYVFTLNAAAANLPGAVHVVFCPPAVYLPTAKQSLPQNARLKLGAQNCHASPSGAYTGEVSAPMLAESGAAYVILGHSERRAMGETDEAVLAKAEAALTAGLIPVLCIGESEADYTAKRTSEVLSRQLSQVKKLPARRYLVAYEPIWAIGTGKTPTIEEISAVHRHIKSVLGTETRVLYGGSVNAGNAKEILALCEVSGALIGGASLDAPSMKAIIAAAPRA